MEESAFKELAARVWDEMPARFKEQVENVALLVEDEPSAEVRKEEDLQRGETLLGRYQGIPNTARGDHYGIGPTLPDTITLYRLPLLREAKDLMEEREFASEEEAIAEAVRETIWHEVGHYFGFDDDAIHEREDEGTNRFR